MKTLLTLTFFCFLNTSINAQQIPYFKSTGISDFVEIKTKKNHVQIDYTIDVIHPITKENLSVTTHFFQNLNVKKAPLLILVPPIVGVSMREKSAAKHFNELGYHVIVIEPIKNIFDNTISILQFENALLSFVASVRSVIDVMEEKPEIDKNNMFLMASSMGAIYSSIVISIDQRINSSVLILGGAPISDIMAESTQKYIVRYRESRMEEENLKTVEEFKLKMKENLSIEPLDIIKASKHKPKVYISISTKDKTVPSIYQRKLLAAFNVGTDFTEYNIGHTGLLMKSHLFGLEEYSNFFGRNRNSTID